MKMADEIDGENGVVAEHSRVLEASKSIGSSKRP